MILRTTHGICNQLFNCPLEMFIEYRIFENLKELHPSQFISLCNLQEEALSILTNKEIRRLTPPAYIAQILRLTALMHSLQTISFKERLNIHSITEPQMCFKQANNYLTST